MKTENWTPIIRTCSLAMKVLVVARTRIEGSWSAYCDAVPGNNHDVERAAVLANGCKISEGVARAMFPMFDELPYNI